MTMAVKWSRLSVREFKKKAATKARKGGIGPNIFAAFGLISHFFLDFVFIFNIIPYS